MRVVYSAPGESADDIIERLVRSDGSSYTVCTADFALQRAAIASGAARARPARVRGSSERAACLHSHPDIPFRARVSERLSPEALRSLEKLRREAEGR